MTKQETQNLALLRLSYCPGLSSKKISILEKNLNSLEEVFYLSLNGLLTAGLDFKTAEMFISWRKNISLNKIINDLNQENINFISWHNQLYPILLKEIYSPPPIIFYKGCWTSQQIKDQKFLSVVGARKCSPYAKKIITELLPNLIAKNVIIISGLALGIDALAHACALKNNGKTWAVLGSGLNKNVFYPPENFKLAEEIIKNDGLLLSELPPYYTANKFTFPRRNRIISGLSQAVLIVEAGIKSGSLITANYALQQNRDVLTIPANIFWEEFLGNNNLIKAGAIPILDQLDLFNYFGLENSLNKIKTNKTKVDSENNLKTKHEFLIYKIIYTAFQCGEKVNHEFLYKKTKLDTSQINSTLTILELKNLITLQEGFWKPCI